MEVTALLFEVGPVIERPLCRRNLRRGNNPGNLDRLPGKDIGGKGALGAHGEESGGGLPGLPVCAQRRDVYPGQGAPRFLFIALDDALDGRFAQRASNRDDLGLLAEDPA